MNDAPSSLQLSALAADAASQQHCQVKSVTISWRLFNKPKPSVRETKARPQHGLDQNAAIHREGEAGGLAKPFMDRERDL